MAMNPKNPRGLGRGLSALMSDVKAESSDLSRPRQPDLHVPVENVAPNPDQPRRAFDSDRLQELADSIAEKGIIQPLIVRRVAGKNQEYQIVAGERRWRAAQIAKLHKVPVIVRDYNDTEVLEIAIIENIQRADLNAIDEAAAYRQLMDKFGHTQEQLATSLGKSRSHIANHLRLLNLPDEVQSYVVNGQLSAGHARAMVGYDGVLLLAREVIRKRLSVRETEQRVKKRPVAPQTQRRTPGAAKDADTVLIENELSATLGMKVSIDHAAGAENGKLTISYKSLEQLDDLLRALSGG